MEYLFPWYLWLVFPLGWFVASAFGSVMNYFRQKDLLKTIKTYADRGQEPPEALLKQLERNEVAEERKQGGNGGCRRGGSGDIFSMVLFGVMALGFGYAAATNMFGVGEAWIIVAFVMGALFAAFAVTALVARRRDRE